MLFLFLSGEERFGSRRLTAVGPNGGCFCLRFFRGKNVFYSNCFCFLFLLVSFLQGFLLFSGEERFGWEL
jgi:hypothetical protein